MRTLSLFKEIVKAKALEAKGRKIRTPSAWSDGQLLIRDQNELKCFDLS